MVQEGIAMLDITDEELDAMEMVDVRTVDIDTLTDIRDIKIDTKLPVEKKLALFAEQTNNLFIHRIGNYVVKVRFQKEGPTIDDKMEEYLRHLAEIQIWIHSKPWKTKKAMLILNQDKSVDAFDLRLILAE